MLVTSILTLILLTFTIFRQFDRYEQQNEQVTRSYAFMGTLEAVRSAFVTESFYRRGYYFKATPQVAAQIDIQRARVFANLRETQLLASKNETQRLQAKRLDSLLRDKHLPMNRWLTYRRTWPDSVAQYLRKDISQSIEQGDQDTVFAQIARMIATERKNFEEKSLFKARAARNTPLVFSLLSFAALGFIVYVFVQLQRELGERLRTQAALERTLQDVKHKNETLQRINFLTAHHLREPLRKAQTFLSKHQQNGESKSPELEKVAQNLQRLDELLTDLNLYVATFQNGHHREQVDLNEIFQQVQQELQPTIQRQRAHISALQPLPIIYAEQSAFTYMLRELLNNALKYHLPQQAPTIQIVTALNHQTQTWSLTVSDQGLGFDMQYAEKVFDIFERLHANHEYTGTGVGLAICKQMVSAHGGQITAQSRPNEGTSITLSFPQAMVLAFPAT